MKTALQILIDNYEKLLSKPNPENEMYEQGVQHVINAAKTLLQLEKEQIKEAYKRGAYNIIVDDNEELFSEDYFNSKYRNNG